MPEVGRPRGTIDTDLHLPPVSPITGKDHSPGRASVPIPEPVRPNVPIVPIQPVSMEPIHEYHARHVHPVTYVHPELVVGPESRQTENAPILTPISKPNLPPNLEPNLDEPNLASNLVKPEPTDKAVPQNLPPSIASGPVSTKFPTKMDFAGRGIGRERTFFETIEVLAFRREKGAWPSGLKPGMQNYYKGAYPEYFTAGKRAEQRREANQQKADRLRAENRPRRRKVKSVLQPDGSQPIDFQSRRRASS